MLEILGSQIIAWLNEYWCCCNKEPTSSDELPSTCYTSSIMAENLIAKSSITINVPVAKVWDVLVNSSIIKKYMFGTEVVSNWKENSPIVWKGLWQGKPYADKGLILKIVPEHVLQYTHFSSLSGVADVPENYHILTYKLFWKDGNTEVSLSQDNNLTEEDLKVNIGTSILYS